MAKEKTVPVTVLTTLGDQVPTFEMPITLKKLDGSDVQFKVTCKALRKTEWAGHRDARQRALFEGMQAANKKAEELTAAGGDAPSYIETAIANIETYGAEAGIREGITLDAALILQFAEGWSLTEPLTAKTLELMEDKFGGSLGNIIGAYDKAIYQGRLGN
ncbi:phage tail assembly chaperone [Acidovorax sp. Leaf160]|uniref:phage tail assembly chaperone n=1 Tax=Acidovorax sp. Leaf160 TaxID=1736280 RepID=UPI0006F94ED6|nr:phage tail assembly chaperone [Acidovorax sp. Leaf160]KQR62659.1 hypothetical protein ASF94_15685 [Acidovorax sp. Leaf160]